MVLAVLFVIGVYYVAREVSRRNGLSLGTARTRARTRATARPGRPPSHAARVTRRAGRQAVTGWWAAEIARLFPHTRHGIAAGWDEHRRITRELERDRVRRRAEHAGEWERLSAEIDAYLEKWREALERMQHPVGDPPLADGKTPGAGPAGPPSPPVTNGRRPPNLAAQLALAIALMRLRQRKGTQAPAPAGGNGTTNGGPVAGDATLDETRELIDKILTEAESLASRDKTADETAQLADGLGAVLHGGDLPGEMTELAALLKHSADLDRQITEHAAKAKQTAENEYGTIQEAVDSSNADAPEPEFLQH
jgi:hypothetical protein